MNPDKLFDSLDTGVKALILLIVTVMTVAGFMQVWCRYVMHSALPWSEELIRYCFIWSTFLSVPVCIRESRHARIDLLSTRLSGRARDIYEIAILILEFCVFLVMIWFGWKFAVKNLAQLSPAMRIPVFYVILSAPVGGVLGVLYIVNQVRGYLGKGGAA